MDCVHSAASTGAGGGGEGGALDAGRGAITGGADAVGDDDPTGRGATATSGGVSRAQAPRTTTRTHAARYMQHARYLHRVERRYTDVVRRGIALAGVAALAACGLTVAGGGPGAVIGDEAGIDAGGPDAVPVDAPTADVRPTDDSGVDAGSPLPSNVDASLVISSAADLVGPSTIDTTTGFIDGLLPPAGITVTKIPGGANGVTVIAVGKLTVDKELTVTGDRALVVLAASDVTIGARIRVDADMATAGPGGYGPGLGPGAGKPGVTGAGNDNSGGGGAGHHDVGGKGGSGGGTAGGDGGATYKLALVGGSGGGRGDPSACALSGGAGGGAIQIFSLTSIGVKTAGGVHAGGGGAVGTGTAACPSGSGPGGGAGGYVLLEAPRVTVLGIVAANGGGGAGGDVFDGPGSGPGGEGTYSAAQAAGSVGSQSTGGKGGSLEGTPTAGGSSTNGAGGGGSAGFIHLRFRGTGLDRDGGTISPVPEIDDKL